MTETGKKSLYSILAQVSSQEAAEFVLGRSGKKAAEFIVKPLEDYDESEVKIALNIIQYGM